MCGSCIYWENCVCYKHGTRRQSNDNICENYIKIHITDNYEQ